MKLAIMQPYFLPYIGYFQLMNAVDEFVIYDNIQFSKGGWMHRNRILLNGADHMISLPLKRDSDYLDVRDRQLADSFPAEREKLLRKIDAAYRKAPCYLSAMPVVEQCLCCNDDNLFRFIYHSLEVVCQYLGITTKETISSTINANHDLKGKDRVMAICQSLSADHYINPIGGTTLYDKDEFAKKGIRLSFLQSGSVVYQQFGNDYIPSLSIADVMMFNSVETIRTYLDMFELI